MSTNEAPTNFTVRRRSRADSSFLPKRGLLALMIVAALIIVVLLALLGYQWAYAERIHEGVTVYGADIGGMNRVEASATLTQKFDEYLKQPVQFRYGERQWTTTLGQIGLQIDLQKTIDSAFAFGRSGSPVTRLQTQLGSYTGKPVAIKPKLSTDETRRADYFKQLSRQIDQPVKDATLSVDAAQMKAVLTNSQPGQQLDVDKSIQVLEQAILNQGSTTIDLVVAKNEPAVVKEDLEPIKAQVEKIIGSPLKLTFEDKTWSLDAKQLAGWVTISPQSGGSSKVQASLSTDPLKKYLEELAKTIDRPAINARFNYDSGSKQLTAIKDSVDGAKLDVEAAINAIKAQAITDNRQVALPITSINPLVRSSDSSAMVVKDLIEEDSTSYAGSIPERAHNVELAATRLNGVVVGPGQTFSFNNEIGPVTLASGYQIGYGITVSGTEMITVPSEGGGICQVATTLFHPVFWAGYPISERIGHLYWIPKYGQAPKGLQGLDATVDTAYDKEGKLLYSVDFKFENPTENAILIQSHTANNKVYFQLWGVKPDWEVKVEGPVITDIVKSNPEQVKQNDPTMPAGKTLWVEEARDGFKSVITRTVSKGGKVIQQQQIITRYNPSRNVLLVGTKGATPVPSGTPGASTTKTPAPSGTPAPAAPAATATKAPAAAATKAPAPTATKTH